MKVSRCVFASVTTLVVVLVSAALLVGMFFPVMRESIYVCETTGSVRYQRTWFHLIPLEAYATSPLETYVESRSPSRLRHRWMWVSSTYRNLAGRAVEWADSVHATLLLATFIESGPFDYLSDEDKGRVYEVLVRSGGLSDEQKRKLYSELLNSGNEADLDRAITKWEARLGIGEENAKEAPVP